MTNHQGPWTHRWLIRLFTLLLGVLIYWLLGFVVDDVGRLEGPNYDLLEEQSLDQTLVQTANDLATQVAEIKRETSDQQKRQSTLRDSTNNSQTTMNQLLDLQRLNLQNGATPSDDEREALAESQKLFLENQRQYQALNQEIATLDERLRDVEESQRNNHGALEQARQPIRAEYQRLVDRHQLKIDAVKLAFLTPLLLIGVVVYIRYRSGTYGTFVYAFGVAVLVKVGIVMHDTFPELYVKYIYILVTLAVAVRILVYLLRMVAHPKTDWLIRQYREAYEAFLCPVCGHPIRRGPLKYVAWTRRSIRRLATFTSPENMTDQPYTCPACATQLYHPCEACGAIRHSLLPACEKCGTVTAIEPDG